jgi:hypothetical protein
VFPTVPSLLFPAAILHCSKLKSARKRVSISDFQLPKNSLFSFSQPMTQPRSQDFFQARLILEIQYGELVVSAISSCKKITASFGQK